MPRFVKAIYHPSVKAAEYIAEDGRHLIRSGGSLPWRICNMGDLVSPVSGGVPAPKKTKGFIGFAKPENSELHFFIFPDHEIGKRELKNSLLRKYKGHSLAQMVEKYAPRDKYGSKNNTDKYVEDLSKLTGLEKSALIGDLSNEQLDSVIEGIARIEGYYADVDSRKEIWVDVSHIQATDGTRPVAEQEIVIRTDGKDTLLKSNAIGQFPPIPHSKDPVEIHGKDEKGNLKKIGELPAGGSQRYSLLVRIAEFFGKSMPVEAPATGTARKHAIQYPVAPNDNLGKIAKLFGTTVERIKLDNHLKGSKIYPGQVLIINDGSPPNSLPPSPPKKAVVPARNEIKKIPRPTPQPSKDETTGHAHKNVQNNTIAARSKDGKGEALSLIAPEEGTAPWMKYALAEAKRHKGADESVIEKTVNYHKDIHDGQLTLVGDNHAWCAAFVNWCLLQAGYPIENPKETGFVDRNYAMGRAHGFIKVKGKKDYPKQKIEDVKLVANPLFKIIDKPVYGAIAIVTSASGNGHHAAFVYGIVGENTLCLLGGNQGGTISFMPQNVEARAARKEIIKTRNGDRVVERKAQRDHLVFLLPSSYDNPLSNGSDKLKIFDPANLNLELGIKPKRKNSEVSTR